MAIIADDVRRRIPIKRGFYEQYITDLMAKADIRINGRRLWDMKVNDKAVYKHLFQRGSLGLGESYMQGLWDCLQLDEMIFRVLKAGLESQVEKDLRTILYGIKSKLLNLQSRSRVYEVAKKHYDLGNDLFIAMLDKRMMYSCAYWKEADDLETAQENKLDLICRKLKLESGLSLLDIGCGWGGLAQFAAERYKVRVVGITISKEQVELAKERCEGLPVEIRLQDYRSLNEKFDRVVSIGMFEHVGYKNYTEYMRTVQRVLKADGLFLLHTIGRNDSVTKVDAWINKYIFPNGMLPSLTQIARAAEKRFIIEDLQNIGPHYDRTLMAWLTRFRDAWPELQTGGKYDGEFYRMWVYYLSCCAAAFRAKDNNLWQIVMSLPGNTATYESVR